MSDAQVQGSGGVSSGSGPPRLYPQVPGPADRVHFLDEQRRHRRASRYYGVLGAVTALVAGIPLSLVVTPLAYLILLLGLRIADLTGHAPPGAVALGSHIALVARSALAALFERQWPSLDAAMAAALLVPGGLVMVVLWLTVRQVLRRAGARAAVLALHARPPVSSDFEETQLQNLAEEMAIAAGLPPFRVQLVDGTAANAAAVGTDPTDAVLVVSRPLLDQLPRDETQAIVGHLVASVGNGDLRIATLLLSVQQALGLLRLMFDAPFGRRSRRAIVRLLRTALRPPDEAEAAWVAELLGGEAMEMEDDLYRSALEDEATPRPRRILRWVLLFPLVLLAVTAKLTTIMMTSVVLGPAFAALWRRRRRLADAMAVQLTRNPDALSRGLQRLGSLEHHLPGGRGAAHLFVVWERTAEGKGASRIFGGVATLTPSLRGRRKALGRMGATPPPRGWSYRLKEYFTGLSGQLLFLFVALVPVLAGVGALMLVTMLAANFLVLGLALVGVHEGLSLIFGPPP